MTDPPRRTYGGATTSLAVLAAGWLILAAYLILRYGGRWGENDSAVATRAMQALLEGQRLASPAGGYPNGYGWQALGLSWLQLGGITLPQLQLYLQPMLMAWIVVPAWLLYRQMLRSERAATLACAILLVQPEFLFPLLRGTHEKFSRGLMFVALYLFVKSLDRGHPLPRFAGLVVAFYLALYAIIAFNALSAFSFVAALAGALLLLAVLGRLRVEVATGRATVGRRLFHLVVTAAVLAYAFTFFLFKPAQHDILILGDSIGRIAGLLVNARRTSLAGPYGYTAAAWVSGLAYVALSLADWLLLGASAAIWLRQTATIVKRRVQPGMGELMMWSLYAAFAIQGALGILLDLSGALGSNLQVRVFPSFAMAAAPMLAAAATGSRWAGLPVTKVVRGAGLALLGAVAVLSVLKATNEPLLSNKWIFHTRAEMRALDHAAVVLPGRAVWAGFDERLSSARTLRDPRAAARELPDISGREGWTRDLLVSNVIRARAVRLGREAPDDTGTLITYDNGEAQLHHLRPRTPFQR